ncbi:MAG: helix-turn-helix transcriptional regulator [Steroidobacteraceae bacterium]
MEPRAIRLSCREAAARLGVSERTLEAWRRERRGPQFFRPPLARPFYLESDIDDFLRAFPARTKRHG